MNWWPTLKKIAHQDPLLEDYFSDELEWVTRDWSGDRVLGAAAFWRAIYKVLLSQASKFEDWHVITHEQLCQDPIGVFKGLYTGLDLPWSETIENKIIKMTGTSDSTETKNGKVQDFYRNSSEIFETRRNSLSLAERQAIFEVVEDVALQIYSKESFAI